MKYHKIASFEAHPKKGDHVLLLYSGGLDTSVMLKWIQDHYQVEVSTLTIDIGQKANFNKIKKKALKLGAKEAIIIDAKEKFAKEVLTKAIKANGTHLGDYHLFCPLGRVTISQVAVQVAKQKGAKIIAHGCTGKGNDQVRFDSYIHTLDPDLKILAPVREWSLGRDEEIAYAKKHNIEIPRSIEKPYAHDDNLFGCSSECAEIEEIDVSPPLEKFLQLCVTPENAPDSPATVTISFEKGVPTKINDMAVPLTQLITSLNQIGANHAIGISYVLEDRIIGIKARNVFEEPGAHILIKAHKMLEQLVCSKEENAFKSLIDQKWADLCFSAKWFDPLMNNLNAYLNEVNAKITGEVTVHLYKGVASVTALSSPNSLVDKNLATFMKNDVLNQNASAGFIEHYCLATKTAHQISQKTLTKPDLRF
jgi:argininosuccinate synthase